MRTCLLLSALLLLSVCGNAQTIITTVAGTGVAGALGDGGPASAAMFYRPMGVDVDSVGNIYIADYDNHKIRKIWVNDSVSTIAGTGAAGFGLDTVAATAQAIYHPFDVKVDTDGNVYFSDGVNRVLKIDTLGKLRMVAGIGMAGFAGDGGPAVAANLDHPAGLLLDGRGNLLIADQHNNRIRKVDLVTGIITTAYGTGVGTWWGDGGPATAACMWHPTFLYMDSARNLYISDKLNHRVRKVSTSGIISTFAGNGLPGTVGDGGQATSASISYPGGVVMDVAGNVYLADSGNHKIRKINTDGIISTYAGSGVPGYFGDGGPATIAKLNSPVTVFLDINGKLIIVDHENNRFRGMMTAVGVDKWTTETSGLLVYPNPNTGCFKLNVGNAIRNTNVTITDAAGQFVYFGKISDTDISLELVPGVYFVRVGSKVERMVVR